MKLFLASHASDKATMQKLESQIGGFENKTVAYIPTASNGENNWEFWKNKEDGTWKYVNTLPWKVHEVLLENYRNESVIQELKDRDVIWFAGGMAGYLAYWMRRCSLDLHLPEILKEKGWYVGSSAGSMVAGHTLQISNWGNVDGERGAEGIEPMKFVDFDIFPHYSESMFKTIKDKYTGKKIYLLKDGEEIIVKDGRVEVVGEERIISNDK